MCEKKKSLYSSVGLRGIRGDWIVTGLLTWPLRKLPNLQITTKSLYLHSNKGFDVRGQLHFFSIPCTSLRQLSIIHLPKSWRAAGWACTHSMPTSSPALILLLLSSTSSAWYIVCPWQTASPQSPSCKCLLIKAQVWLWGRYTVFGSPLMSQKLRQKAPPSTKINK